MRINFNSPKMLLLDATGAFLSILLLYILYIFEEYVGMPKKILSVFIGIAIIFCFYSSMIYLISPLRWRIYLKIIAILNSVYCLFTMYHVFLNFENLTLYGQFYFAGEVIVILLLSFYEIKIATKNQ